MARKEHVRLAFNEAELHVRTPVRDERPQGRFRLDAGMVLHPQPEDVAWPAQPDAAQRWADLGRSEGLSDPALVERERPPPYWRI
ncbi:MAG: hypothetical protein HY922_12600 [Elusimicrobia bacterium]|nr:hypothetical protein [Elusimicrobiota bacterium]